MAMILLKDVFTLLATGEFSNIALKKDRVGALDESEYNKVIGHLNLALVELYKRFKFKEGEVTLHTFTDVPIYYIRPDRMVPLNYISETRYIEQPPDNDGNLNIIEIKAIHDELGNEVTMNNRYLTPYVKQQAFDVLKFFGLTSDQIFYITYQAHPSPIILDDDFDLNVYAIDASNIILEAVLYYIAARVYQPMGANNSTANADKSSIYQNQYELACQKIEQFGLDIQTDDEPDTYEKDGWA